MNGLPCNVDEKRCWSSRAGSTLSITITGPAAGRLKRLRVVGKSLGRASSHVRMRTGGVRRGWMIRKQAWCGLTRPTVKQFLHPGGVDVHRIASLKCTVPCVTHTFVA
eukprot:scaffold51748_cov33-Tisochrysis_lutea.AAC.1